jgi:nucleoside-triphosphatase
MRHEHLKCHLLLTGVPGSGKTSALRAVAERLAAERPAGFYTAEIRSRGERRGFRLVSLTDGDAVIAHVELAKTHRVGKYGVDVAAIDRAVDAALANRKAGLYLIDEIGKMECLCARFVAQIQTLLDGRVPVIATVASRGAGFIAEVKRRADCELWTLTRANRDAMPEAIVAWLATRLRARRS